MRLRSSNIIKTFQKNKVTNMETKEKSDTMFSCSHCEKVFKYNSEKTRHEISHLQKFECELCNKKFGYISALRRHKKQHERTSSVKCEECNRKFRDEVLLQRHIKYAHKGTFSCPKCSSVFSSDLALRTHLKTHKPVAERRFKCSSEGCDKSFNFSHHLKHHELTHSNVKQHFCGVCGKGFIQSHHLKTHLKSHDPSEWLYCDFKDCKKKFSTEYAKKRHMSTTHKNKPDSGISSDSNSCDASIKSNDTFEESCSDDIAQVIEVRGSFIPSSKATDCPVELNSVDTNMIIDYSNELNSVDTSNITVCPIELNSMDTTEMTECPIELNSMDATEMADCPVELNSMDTSKMTNCPIELNSVDITKFPNSPAEIDFEVDSELKAEAVSTQNETLDTDVGDCKLAIGSCIAKDSCICEEINKTAKNNKVTRIRNIIKRTSTIAAEENSIEKIAVNNNDIENILEFNHSKNDDNNNTAVLVKKQFDISNNNYDKSNPCEGCECAGICTDEDRAICNNTRTPNNVPNIENTNGVIKLKNTFDIDFKFSDNKFENFVPFSTCKDVIGKCIVEGDGCLCARMIVDEQHAMAQEIDDITPQPKTD